jgi:hypothetical protein
MSRRYTSSSPVPPGCVVGLIFRAEELINWMVTATLMFLQVLAKLIQILPVWRVLANCDSRKKETR